MPVASSALAQNGGGHGGGRGASLRVADNMTAPVHTVPATATLHETVQLLAAHHVSCLVVVEGDRPIGTVTERTLVRAAAGDPGTWGEARVGDVIARPLRSIGVWATVTDAVHELARHGVRHLPVVESDGRLVGIVTQTDLLRASHRGLEEYAVSLERVVWERTAELREIERRRDDLVDLTVHDIKNSICVIDSALEMMEAEPADAAMTAPLLRRATARIAHLVGTLLDLSRLESGAMPLRITDTPWATLCEPVLAETGLIAQSKSLAFNRTGDSYGLVRCDAQLIERVLLNLLDNAVNAAPDGSMVDIHAERTAEGGFLVRVGNRGQPIPLALMPVLFSKHRSGEEERPLKRLGGWGLGLIFCRLAVERHGGTIRAISPWLDGEGVAFEFVLPPEPR
jgi:signal transduction histidine kinase